MGVRNEVSKKSKYYLPKYRYLELKYFCLQYKEWLAEYSDISIDTHSSVLYAEYVNYRHITDETAKKAIKRAQLSKKIEAVHAAIREALNGNEYLYYGEFLLTSVTEEKSWEKLVAWGLDCPKHQFYELRRKFFYILSQKLQG